MHAQEEGSGHSDRVSRFSLACSNYIIELYGLRRFLADVDRDRQFWRESDSIVAAILDWTANEGLPEFLHECEMEYGSAHEFRNRFLLQAVIMMRGG